MDEQDMRVMGGLVRKIPLTYTMLLIGSMSLMGFPFLSGFYSKDTILELAAGSYSFDGQYGYILGTISALFTAAYSGRIIYHGLIGKPKSSIRKILMATESSWIMTIPLILLALGSIYSGYVLKDIYIGLGTPYSSYRNVINTNNDLFTPELLPTHIKLLPVVLSILGAIFTLKIQNFLTPSSNSSLLKYKIFTFLSDKWHFDFIYNKFINVPLFFIGHVSTFKLVDKGVLELFGPLGLSKIITHLSVKNSLIQTGLVSTYAFSVIVAVSLLFFTPLVLPIFIAFILLS